MSKDKPPQEGMFGGMLYRVAPEAVNAVRSSGPINIPVPKTACPTPKSGASLPLVVSSNDLFPLTNSQGNLSHDVNVPLIDLANEEPEASSSSSAVRPLQSVQETAGVSAARQIPELFDISEVGDALSVKSVPCMAGHWASLTNE